MGVHYVGELSDANSPVRAAFDHLTEGRLQWNPMPDIYDRIVIGGRVYDFPAGIDRIRDRMKAYFPGARGAGYEQLKQYFNQRLRDEVECLVPGVRDYIDYTELSTPLSTRHFANYAQGEIYGLSAVPGRFRLRDLGARTPVRNLYLTGADVTMLGVAGALFGGVITASLVLGRNLMSVVTRPAPVQARRMAA